MKSDKYFILYFVTCPDQPVARLPVLLEICGGYIQIMDLDKYQHRSKTFTEWKDISAAVSQMIYLPEQVLCST